MKFSRLITVLIWRCYFHSETFAAVLPSLLWDPRNYLFSCENLTLKVRIDDRINLICPKAELNTLQLDQAPNAIDLFEKVYLLNEDQFLNYQTCNTSFLPSSNFAWLCNNKSSHLIVFDDNPLDPNSKPKFLAGSSYYLISTSEQTESKIDQNIGGSCRGNPPKRLFTLKLKIYVCKKDEVEKKMCEICQTVSCYEKGCGKWLTLSDLTISNHIWNGSHCLRKLPRQCISPYFQCDGLPYSYEVENNKEACKLECDLSNTSSSIAYDKSIITSSSTLLSSVSSCSVTTFTEFITSLVISTAYISSVSYSTIKTTVQVTVTKTETSPCSQSVTVTQPARAEKVYVDIEYDKKFYITIIATIVGAIFVGIFVAHACVTYFTSKRAKKQNIYYINEKDELVDTEETKIRRVSVT
ncbi:uncharacterized protein LOC100212375 isoform X1 [Hydra vulgaris]|uniref:uncharacterized protein LOC100212375 isoform X1 n=1 Tax=Hydra vulgaris TaxID=6087 RepID=UPI000640BA2A|nr:uncharacterized protein LOC100212375 [Hydra vulgaris]